MFTALQDMQRPKRCAILLLHRLKDIQERQETPIINEK